MKSSFEKYFEGKMALGGCGLWIIGILVVLYFIYSWITDIIEGDFKTIIVTVAFVMALLSVILPVVLVKNNKKKVKKNVKKKTNLPVTGWKNKSTTITPTCPNSSWKQYWIEKSNREWPESCSIEGCRRSAVFGSVVCNPNTDADYVIPVCAWCCDEKSVFSIKEEDICVRVEEKIIKKQKHNK